MKVVTIIQARTTSSRLPYKVMLDIYGETLLERVIKQARKISNSDELWVATSTHKKDDMIEILCNRKNVRCHRGSLADVRSRFHDIAVENNADIIVRITADNPFTEPAYAEELIDFLKSNSHYDYARMDKSTILDGSHSEVFTMKALEKSVSDYNDTENQEHVTPAIIQNMRLYEATPSNEDLIAKKPYFIGVDTFKDYKRSTLLFQKYGETETLKYIIKKVNLYGKAI
jgi:spore coat polysaccharide biosynthesis protein SpsF